MAADMVPAAQASPGVLPYNPALNLASTCLSPPSVYMPPYPASL